MPDQFLGFTQQNVLSPPERLYLPEKERLKTHMLVLGSTGEGKSKFLEWLIRGDIKNCNGLCVLDIHGDLYHGVKKWLTYNYNLTQEIILLNPSEGGFVKGYNPFRPKKGVDIDVQVAGMVQALLRVWGQENTDQTPTLDRVLRLVFYAMIVKNIPLYEIVHLINFDARDVREDVISSFSEPVIVSAWQQLQNIKTIGQWRGEVLSTDNRLFRIAQSNTLRRFMGVMDDAFNVDVLDVMNNGKILLVNLKESGVFDEFQVQTFAALLLNDFFKTAIMFRDRDTLGHDPLPFYLYLDEWQNIATIDIEKILAQARKFGLLLTLANQDISQIARKFDDHFVDTLLNLCKVKACFGGLNRNSANRMVDEMLVGQLDLNETKDLLVTTKFWPEYDRDKVFTTATGITESDVESEATMRGTALGRGTVAGVSIGNRWDSIDGWVPATDATTSADSTQFVESEATMQGSARGTGRSETQAEADIPIYRPVPFSEVTSRTTYRLDEQRFRWSDRFMEQYERHCYIKLPRQHLVGMLVPFVKEYYVSLEMLAEYERDIAAATQAKQPQEVDLLLHAQPTLFLPEKSNEGDEDLPGPTFE